MDPWPTHADNIGSFPVPYVLEHWQKGKVSAVSGGPLLNIKVPVLQPYDLHRELVGDNEDGIVCRDVSLPLEVLDKLEFLILGHLMHQGGPHFDVDTGGILLVEILDSIGLLPIKTAIILYEHFLARGHDASIGGLLLSGRDLTSLGDDNVAILDLRMQLHVDRVCRDPAGIDVHVGDQPGRPCHVPATKCWVVSDDANVVFLSDLVMDRVEAQPGLQVFYAASTLLDPNFKMGQLRP
mmetsp:Transcript_11197/g.25105  ORF Transcript_11197/g.25105 Transcript_11197/m.25105 type:complete len:238 (+) Transcript_11197:2801-3514(+)